MAQINPKKILLYVSITVLTISVPAAVFLATQPRTTIWQSRAGLAKSAYLYLWPAKMTLATCPKTIPIQTCPAKKVEVILSSKAKVGSVNLILKYDPEKIHLVDNLIYPGVVDAQKNTQYLPFEFYTNRQIDNTRGIIKLDAKNQSKEGKATFATFWIVGLIPGQSTVEIIDDANLLDSAKVWDEKNQNNILKSTSSLQISIQ